jgi:hypothetical protein
VLLPVWWEGGSLYSGVPAQKVSLKRLLTAFVKSEERPSFISTSPSPGALCIQVSASPSQSGAGCGISNDHCTATRRGRVCCRCSIRSPWRREFGRQTCNRRALWGGGAVLQCCLLRRSRFLAQLHPLYLVGLFIAQLPLLRLPLPVFLLLTLAVEVTAYRWPRHGQNGDSSNISSDHYGPTKNVDQSSCDFWLCGRH